MSSPSSSSSTTNHLKPLPSLSSKLHLSPYTHPDPTSTTSPTPIPLLSRIDPELAQREPPITISQLGVKGLFKWAGDNWYDFGWFLGKKGWDVSWSLIKYGVVGPPRPSWGIEMTTIAALMRNLSKHSSLADITLIRNFISIHHLLPLPPDAIVTPVRFLVGGRKEGLKGFLSELDKVETGTRSLSGEWIVNKSVWARLRSEARSRASSSRKKNHRGPHVGPSHGSLDENEDAAKEDEKREGTVGWELGLGHGEAGQGEGRGKRRRNKEEKVIYYIHGGAYYVGQATTHRTITIALSKHCNCRVFAINYRLAPEVRFPDPLLDVVYGYFRLVEDLRIQPKNIIVMGDSAGGGLSLALIMYLRDAGYRDLLPKGMVLMSPWVDLTMSCGSWDENAEFDVIPIPGQDDHLNPVSCYLGPEGIKKFLTHPYASPLFGDFEGLPPMLVQAGDAECLRDEITLLAHKAALAGVQVQHELHVDQVHVFQSFPFLESAGVAFRSIAKFVRGLRNLPTPRLGGKVLVGDEEEGSGGVRDDEEGEDGSRSNTPTDEDRVGSEMEAGETKLVKGDGTEVDIAQAKEDEVNVTTEDVEEILVDTMEVEENDEAERQDEEEAGEERDSLSPLMTTSASLPVVRDHEVEVPAIKAIEPRGTSSVMVEPTSPVQKPFLRRAFSGFSRRQETPGLARRISGSFLPFSSVIPLVSGKTDDPPTQPVDPNTTPPSLVQGLPSSPSWPQVGKRPAMHRPTISQHLTLSPVKPTTRARSQSHSDMISLMNGYSRGGAANRTVVYSPLPVPAGTEGVEVDDDQGTMDVRVENDGKEEDQSTGGLGLSID